ncbi:MAG: poly-beta-1,6-N-acetyl-D-glucosamine N-deacetylase PgaB [Mariprofundus sp.]|nr:poly-beta-1,6-N-acetyl-D-glucosamine N-deacetylase PgaB [Mariprofundus sp.]
MCKLHKLLLIALLALVPALATAATTKVAPTLFKDGQFLVLAYHSVVLRPIPGDKYTITQGQFAEQVDYLNTHGYHPVSVQDILDAQAGKKKLPNKAVLLTFDDAYLSYYDFVVPFLKQYGFPSMLAVVGDFIENPPSKVLPEKLMNWQQIKEVAKSPLVEVASHTYNMHKGIQYNSIGNTGPAVNVRMYSTQNKHYETEQEYRQRLQEDFTHQNKLFESHVGFKPRIIVWPFGNHTGISWDIAKNNGFRMGFTLVWGLGDITNLAETPRLMVESVPIKDFIDNVLYPNHKPTIIRAVQVDLDLIYDKSIEQMDKNLGKLIDRLYAMKVNTVYLQAFADTDGDGSVDSVYFHNRQLPVRSDFFSHAAHQIRIRGIEVYAWIPSLSFIFPDKAFNKMYRIQEKSNGKNRPSQSWYKRLTPFSKDVQEKVGMLYEDLAAYSQIDGILFQDDAYLTDHEDFHPDAIHAYQAALGKSFSLKSDAEDSAAALKWGKYKTQALIDYTKGLMRIVKHIRPEIKFARNIYANMLINPQAEAWFAQNYKEFLNNYDEVIVMAYPRMEKANKPAQWLTKMVENVKAHNGLEKTIFKLQAYDWKKKRWVGNEALLEEMRDVLVAGGVHLAYYPDNALENKPDISTIKLEMSRQTDPFAR